MYITIWDQCNLQFWDILYKVFTIWPLLTPKDCSPKPKITVLLCLNMVHLHSKYEIPPNFTSWDIMFKRFPLLSPVDPKLPKIDLQPNTFPPLIHFKTLTQNTPKQPKRESWNIKWSSNCFSPPPIDSVNKNVTYYVRSINIVAVMDITNMNMKTSWKNICIGEREISHSFLCGIPKLAESFINSQKELSQKIVKKWVQPVEDYLIVEPP